MYQKLLEELKSDHFSGASELARQAARVIDSFCQEQAAEEQKEFVRKFTWLAKELVRAQREITPILNLVNFCLNTLHSQQNKKNTEELAALLSKEVAEFQKDSAQSLKLIWEQGAELLPHKGVLMTFSSSSSVLGTLKEANRNGKKLEVYVPESRPLLEGRRLARMLSEEGIAVNLIIDAACSYFMPKVDLVLIGADSLTETSLVNKVGTYALLLLARQNQKPVWLAVEESKFISQEARGIPAIGGDPGEVWQEGPGGVRRLNPYFEQVPLFLVDKIITKQGILTPSEVPNFIRQFPISPELLEL